MTRTTLGENGMFHIKDCIASSLALAVFITSLSASAEGSSSGAATTDTAKTTQKKVSRKKSSKAQQKLAASKTDTPSASSASTTASSPSTASASPPSKASAPSKTSASFKSKVVPKDEVLQRSGNGNPVAGQEKAELCTGCHGEEGISFEGMVPNLAGQYARYIAKQLRNFQAGTRTHQIMSAIAATVSDDDLADISAFFASREKMQGNGTENKLGKQLFEHGDMSRMMVACINCHGVNGKGKTPTNAVFPVIGGQHKEYIRGQLINFRAGDRSNSPGGVMNIITQKLTDPELEALADYVSGL